MKKRLPIGLSDFKRLIDDNYYYVDKSILIRDIIDDGSNIILLPRPRRFGKTLNLSMLKYFFEKSETDNSYLFKNLNIWKQGVAYTSKLGQYPVIFITFKDVKSNNWGKCTEQIKRIIAEQYRKFKYVLESDLLDDQEKEEYADIINLTASEVAYEYSLKKLSNYLDKYHNKKVIILADEYDVPIQSGYFSNYYDEVVNFMRNLFSAAFKDNNSVEKGVLTGILRLAKESLFSGLNNFNVFSLLNQQYSDYFGLLDNEVVQILKYYNIEFELEEIRNWYNGYVFGNNIIYNPWSIICYVHSWRDGLRPFWVNTSSNDLVKKLITNSSLEVKKELETLLKGEELNKAISDDIVFGEIDRSTDTLWSFLLFSGYLKSVSKEHINKRLYCKLKIPNLEVEYLYEEIILSWFNESIYSDKLRSMLRGLTTGDLETFEYIFREFIIKTFSYFDTSGTEPEKVYHAFVLGLLVSLNDSHYVKSNRESGYGRYDVMIIPKDINKKGIIIEFKKTNKFKNETLEQAVEAALKQIEEKRYETELTDIGVKDIIKLAIAFDGKEIMIKEQ